MADAKVTALNELLEAIGEDLLYIVDDPAGAPEGKKITLANLVASFLEYGIIYTDDGAVAQAGITSTPVQLALYASNGPSTGNVTPSAAGDKITLGNAGTYLVFFSLSMTGTANTSYEAHARIDGVQQDDVGQSRKFGGTGDVGSASCAGIITVTAGQELTVYIEKIGGGTMEVTMLEGQLLALRVG